MATLLLVDGVNWGSQQQTGSSSLLSSCRHTYHCDLMPSPCSNRTADSSATTIRCALSNDLLTKMDPPLPRFPVHYPSRHVMESGPQLVLEMQPSWQQSYREEGLDGSSEPSLPNHGEKSRHFRSFSDGQERDLKRNQRASPSYLSVSQSRRAMANGAVLQAASSPLHLREIRGTAGFYVGFLTVALGIVAVLQRGGLLGNSNVPMEMCTTCNGHGRKVCSLCKGSGSVTWEGKLKHTDLCPSCLGNRIKQCSDCGGYRSRNEASAVLQRISKAGSFKP